MKKLLFVFVLLFVGYPFSGGFVYCNAADNINPNKPKIRFVLEKNIVGGENILTQGMFQDINGNDLNNIVFVIKYDFILNDDIIIPANSVLEFAGGSISKHGLKGTVQNSTLYAKWFKDSASLIYSINNLTGYNKIELESGKTYLFDEELSPKCSVIIKGNYATIGRANVSDMSKPIIKISVDKGIESITFDKVIFDGGVVSGLPIEIDYHQNVVDINNVSKVVMKNVRFENFRAPYRTGVSPSNDFVNIANYNSVKFDNVAFKNNVLYGEVVVLHPAGGDATPASNVSNDLVEITNSVFDFRGGRCYTAINCLGGRLKFDKNEIYGSIGALNAYVHDSYITNNIYADAESGFVDLSEQGKFYSYNVDITNNTIKNIKKFNHSVYGKNSTHLLECYGAENITVVNNIYEPSSTGSDSDGAGHVFSMSNGTKNVLIKKNRILCNGQLYGAIGGEPNENIRFVDNYVYQGNRAMYGLIRLNEEKIISFERNTFVVSNSEKERITGALVFIDKKGQTLNGIRFTKNKFNCSIATPLFVYVGKGEYPAINNLELRRNKTVGNNMPVSIRNKGGNPAKMKNNRGLLISEDR